MLNTDSRKRSAVGRISCDEGEARLRPFNRPPTTRIAQLLVLGLQIALAVIAALGATRRAVAVGLFLVAGAGLLAAGTLHQHAAALAVGDQRAFSRRLERLLAARRVNLFVVGFLARLFTRHRPVEVGTGKACNLLAELLAQHAGLDLLDRAFGEFAELERPIGDADQPVHLEAEMRHDVADFAVLAFADRKHQPDIGALVALQHSVDRTVFDAVDLDALLQFIELRLRDLAMGADAIAPQPAGVGQFERTRQPAVIGQQQQPLGVEVEPADRDQPRQSFRQIVEHGRPPLGIGMRGHQAARLVIHEQPRPLARRQHLAVDRDHVIGGNVERRRIDHAAVGGDPALRDPFLGVAARGKASAGNHLGDALAGFLDARWLRRALVEFRLALAIGAAAAERRTFCKNLAVVLVLATRPIVPRFTARMLLPVGAAFGPLARTVEFRAIFTRTRKARTLLPAAFVAGSVKARLVEIARTIARGTGIALTAILTLLPRLRITAVCAKILAGATVGRTARKLLVTAKFSLRPVATGAIAIARRPGTEGPIATRTVAVFTKTFATRHIAPLLAAAFSRGIGLLVAKFAIGKTSSRAWVVAITARRPVVAIKIRPVAARLERTRLATIIARAKILTRSTIPGVALAIPGVAIAIPGVALAISEIAAGAIIPVEALRTVA